MSEHLFLHMRTLEWWQKVVQTHALAKQREKVEAQARAQRLRVDMQVGPP